MSYPQYAVTPAPRWPLWPLQAVLTILLLGPPLAALCIATRTPVIADTGQFARDLLATYICPTPTLSYELWSSPMAVCARCWGATIGLWLAWFAARGRSSGALWRRYTALIWPVRLVISALPFLLWVAEIHAWPGVWPGSQAPYVGTLLNGLQAGVCAGLFFCSIWPGLAAHERSGAPDRDP